jgi:hypothetical protein
MTEAQFEALLQIVDERIEEKLHEAGGRVFESENCNAAYRDMKQRFIDHFIFGDPQ